MRPEGEHLDEDADDALRKVWKATALSFIRRWQLAEGY